MNIKTLNDKLLHAGGAFILMWIGLLIGGAAQGPFVGLGLVILAAIVRELYNWRHGGEFDWKDIAATIFGGLLALLTAAVLVRMGG